MTENLEINDLEIDLYLVIDGFTYITRHKKFSERKNEIKYCCKNTKKSKNVAVFIDKTNYIKIQNNETYFEYEISGYHKCKKNIK